MIEELRNSGIEEFEFGMRNAECGKKEKKCELRD